MVAGKDDRILNFLSLLHATPAREGLEATLRSDQRFPSARTVYRWNEKYRAQLSYVPAFTYSALGLATLHVLVESPRGAWERCPYAVAGKWMTTGSRRLLYLRCLVPDEHVATVCEELQRYAEKQGVRCEMHLTADAVHRFLGAGAPPTPGLLATSLLSTQPFVVPVLGEMSRQRGSLAEAWERIHERLGEATKTYLKRRRVNVHNGKSYVHQAMTALIGAQAVGTHVVRYDALCEESVEVIAMTDAADDLLQALGPRAVSVETFSEAHGALLIARVTLQGLKQLLASSQARVIGFTDDLANSAAPIPARWSYEQLFDPQHGWRIPITIIPEEQP